MKCSFCEGGDEGHYCSDVCQDAAEVAWSLRGGVIEEYEGGTLLWWLNGECHREDGPAVEHADGHRSWYLNDKLHREGGPAREWGDGSRSWWINGDFIRKESPKP